MSTFPPPTGRPVTMSPRPDPWAEQLRRDARRRDEQRRRRRARVVPLVGAGVLVLGAFAFVAVRSAVDDRSRDPAGVVTEPVGSTVVGATVAPTTVAPTELVQVERVWLIDRGDGVFDWGVTVRTPPRAPTRSGVVIDVRLVDGDGALVESSRGEVDGIGPESHGAVAGRLVDPVVVPVRLEFEVAVGVASADRALGDVLEVRALDREPESLSGRIRADATAPIDDVTMVMLWVDDDGEVVAAVPRPVESVRPEVDARFEVDLRDEVVPDGRPDAIVWTR